jgi:signal transduction histidine kinase
MERNGYPEETYYTFSYSPVPNDQGGTGGILCANTDDTQRVISERQLALLREMSARTADARTLQEACALIAESMETNPFDLPFAMIYLAEPGKRQVVMADRCCGIDRGHAAAPATASLDGGQFWPFTRVIETRQMHLIPDLTPLGELPGGAWERPPTQAVAMPIVLPGRTVILIAGLNPFRLFDDSYRVFIELVAAQIGASLINALAYEEERQRVEALAELDRAKTTFFSNVSHEFRTPLTLMLGPLEETLAEFGQMLPAIHRTRLETAHRNSLRLLKLVNTLLDFSRIEANRIQASYEPTDLCGLTADLTSLFRSAIEQAGLKLIVDCQPSSAEVYVDREMWEKVIFNLLSNAFKFTFEGEIEVSLRQVGETMRLAVRDTGTGMPAAEIPRLFERFHRIKGARGRTFEGTGIGLGARTRAGAGPAAWRPRRGRERGRSGQHLHRDDPVRPGPSAAGSNYNRAARWCGRSAGPGLRRRGLAVAARCERRSRRRRAGRCTGREPSGLAEPAHPAGR